MLNEKEQAAFMDSINRVQQSAANHLSLNKSASFAIEFIVNLHRAVDKIAEQTDEPNIACHAGCAYCCTVRVEATEPEVFLIVRELKKRPIDQFNAIFERLQKHLDAKEARRKECAFLENNLCSIYPIRPAACRKAHSLSVENCKNFAPQIPQNLEIILKAEALMKGTSGAYRQADLCTSAHELCHAVLSALSDETAEARWREGESVFPE